MFDPNALKVYTDGSAIDNPGGPGGFAIVFDYPDSADRPPELIDSEGYWETTNQRMELLACVRSFEILRDAVKEHKIQNVVLITDSEYIYDNQNRAVHWRANEWKNSHGRPMKNQDLWKKFLTQRAQIPAHLEIRWIKGKTSKILDMVDKAAKEARNNPSEKDFGYVVGRVTPTKTNDKAGATLFEAKGQEEIIRVYRYDEVSKNGECEVRFDLYSEEEGEYISKHSANVKPELAKEIHGQHYYKVLFNSNPAYPMLEAVEEIEDPTLDSD